MGDNLVYYRYIPRTVFSDVVAIECSFWTVLEQGYLHSINLERLDIKKQYIHGTQVSEPYIKWFYCQEAFLCASLTLFRPQNGPQANVANARA